MARKEVQMRWKSMLNVEGQVAQAIRAWVNHTGIGVEGHQVTVEEGGTAQQMLFDAMVKVQYRMLSLVTLELLTTSYRSGAVGLNRELRDGAERSVVGEVGVEDEGAREPVAAAAAKGGAEGPFPVSEDLD